MQGQMIEGHGLKYHFIQELSAMREIYIKHIRHFSQPVVFDLIYTFKRLCGLEGTECTKQANEDNYAH